MGKMARFDQMNPPNRHIQTLEGPSLVELHRYSAKQMGQGYDRPREFKIMSALRDLIITAGVAAGVVTMALSGQAALAFDGTPTQTKPLSLEAISPSEALRYGARQYYSGDKAGALNSLRYAAENGQPMAAWKLGEMYASGDGVKEDDLKAFEYYSQIVREHGDDRPEAPDAPFVASAFVALGNYYLNGISDAVPQNVARARQIFTHAASYFGDPQAQYELGRLYQDSSSRMAVRWYNLAALKGHVGAQARLGETLFTQGHDDERKARGLMWLTIAHRRAHGQDSGWINALHEQYFGLASEAIRGRARAMADTWIDHNPAAVMTASTPALQ
ncbi:tetratricopeptide repeat protein [Roseibium suaedae]|nr:tetratricopeptide repeat protein [Roseibium suaedae]